MYEIHKLQNKGGNDFPSIALLRVSSLGQSEVQHGSLEQQRNAIIKKIQETSQRTGKNYHIIEFIEEDSGVSAKVQNTKNRKDLKRIEELIRSGTAKALFTDRSDRLSRDLEYNIRFSRMMVECEAEYFEVESGKIDFKQQDQFFGYVYRSFNAEAYSVNLSRNVRTQGRRARVNNGKDTNTTTVFGIDAHPTLVCQYVINTKETEQLNMLGWHLIKTRDAVATARYGNELGIRTKVRWIKEQINKDGVRIPPRKVGGELLTGKKLMKMLTSPKVWGHHHFKDDLNQFPEKQNSDGYVRFDYAHGPVLELELIEELKKLQKENKNHNPSFNDDFLLSGFLETENGELYRGDSTTKIKKRGNIKYTYYVARTKLSQIRRLNAKALENDLLERLKEFLLGSDAFIRLIISGKVEQDKLTQKYDTDIGELKNQAQGLQLELDQFSVKIRKLVLSDSDDFQDALLILKEEKSKVECELNMLKESIDKLQGERSKSVTQSCDKEFFQKFKAFFSEFERLSNSDKKMLLKAFMPKIIVHVDFRIEIKVNPAFYEMFENTGMESEKIVRANKRWLGRRDSNSRPTD